MEHRRLVGEAKSATNVRQEYAAYLERYTPSAQYPRPLSFQEFAAVLERWRDEYHQAWQVNDVATMRALEQLLAL